MACGRPEIDSAIRFAVAGTHGGPSHQEAALPRSREDNDPELISRSFSLIDLISPASEQVDR